ncbi:VWA domain-containing protein [Hyphomicrobium sp. CS1GBMeth3]|uniref:VWA domain-containing protein n=1 Tax=Hyphomicrobium sp. CS1GBMeth3 TaxID=1892845 RepID=UPI000931FDAD|nr:VWA domain-containing protein [Hyphomicrobium sp. CS1GBMeth3]
MSHRGYLALLPLLLLAAPTQAADPGTHGPAVIVLDGSGSMWGTIGTEKPAKFELARGALRQALTTLSPKVRLGLMTFGQRRRGDCSDVELLAQPEAGPPDRILSIVDELSPTGKGPLSLTLREAAKQVPAGDAGSIIAIHDGPDNCSQDPCAAAADIAAANPKLRIFLIGFGLEPVQSERHACVAVATGGKVFDTQSSTELAGAISEALTLANLERVDPNTGVAVPAPQAATPPEPAGPPGLRLTASLTDDGKPLAAAVAWSVAKADTPDAPLKSAKARNLDLDLEPGSYVVEARLGEVTRKQTVDVAEKGPTSVKVSLDAGLINLKARADQQGTALAHPLITISAKDSAAPGAGRPVWIGREATTQVVLPAGAYTVRVVDGLAAETSEITLAAGSGVDVSPVLGAGTLALSAVSSAGGAPLQDVTYAIEEDDPDSPEGRREVVRSADPTASFTLPAGTYYVTARSGAAVAHERVALGSGATINHAMTLNLVPITVVTNAGAQADGAGAAPAQPIVIRVLGADGRPPEIARAHGASGTFQLPPGRYRVEAEVMGRNVAAAGIVDLTSGRGGSVQLKLEQGEVSIDARGTGGRHWRIKDGTGRTVLHAGRANGGTTQLAPGRYVLLWDAADKRVEQPFEIKAGERRQLTVGSP